MADELEHASEALLSIRNGGVMEHRIKEENDEEFPSSLGLHRVGDSVVSNPSPQQPLNRRGVPARIRKKNKLFFDDDVVSSVVPRSMLPKSPRGSKTPARKGRKLKEPLETPTASKVDSNGRRVGQKIGMKLRNLLKLPKAHKWVCYEWFYSNIDSPLLLGENDFVTCLKESFPQLKSYKLTRVEWCKMRRLMGKPRRCSQAFFEEERRELERKRMKIRQLQQRKTMDLSTCKDLPAEIPLQLVIGTKVTARLRQPQDGLFTGSVDAVDTSNNTYRITFERQGLGTHSVPDYEVLSNSPVETMCVLTMMSGLRGGLGAAGPGIVKGVGAGSAAAGPRPVPGDGTSMNCFPLDTLESIVRLNKVLEVKKMKVKLLREMNLEAEKQHSYQQEFTEDFSKKYAMLIVELEMINTHLREVLAEVQSHCQKLLGGELNMNGALMPNYLRDQSLLDAREVLDRTNTPIKCKDTLDLIVELVSLVIQVKNLSEAERSSYEMGVLTTSLDTIKNKLGALNRGAFESLIEVHLKHIQSGLLGDHGPFSVSTRQ